MDNDTPFPIIPSGPNSSSFRVTPFPYLLLDRLHTSSLDSLGDVCQEQTKALRNRILRKPRLYLRHRRITVLRTLILYADGACLCSDTEDQVAFYRVEGVARGY
jgi:hypothetical protein